jgi:hypothetical protein
VALAGRAKERHDNVLQKMRKAKSDAGFSNALNFQDQDDVYVDKKGEERPMMLISEIALPLALGYLGGPVYAPIVIGIGEGKRGTW